MSGARRDRLPDRAGAAGRGGRRQHRRRAPRAARHASRTSARAKAEIFGGLRRRRRRRSIRPTSRCSRRTWRALPARRRTFGPTASRATVAYDDVQAGADGADAAAASVGRDLGRAAWSRTLPLIGRAQRVERGGGGAASRSRSTSAKARSSTGWPTVQPAKHRAQLVPVGDRTVLDDCYNAAPPSMRAALDALVDDHAAGRAEDRGARRHARARARLGAAARRDRRLRRGARRPADRASARVGGTSPRPRGATLGARPLARRRCRRRPRARVRAVSRAGDVILVKASRGMRLERVIDALELCAGSGLS